MPNKFPNITCFLDAAGRYSHNENTPLVFAAIGMRSSDVDRARDALIACTPFGIKKWSKDDGTTAKAIFRLIGKRQLYGAVNIIWKNTPAWERYHKTGQEIYAKGVKNSQEHIPFAKSMATLKIHLFGDILADLYGHIMGRNRHLLKKGTLPKQSVTVTAVCDSDVHGELNQKIFKDVLEASNELPKTESETGIRTAFNVVLKTEEEEPLLYLPDHLAGFHYSRTAYEGEGKNDRGSTLDAVVALISKWPPPCLRLREEPFEDEYLLEKSVFDHVLPKKKRDQLLLQLKESSSYAKEQTSDGGFTTLDSPSHPRSESS